MPETKVVCSFYKYVKIDSPAKFQQEHLELCKYLNLKGRILVGEEGINGSVYGTRENVEEYKSKLRKNPLFQDIEFKDTVAEKPAYRKMFVRLRKEIVNFGLNIDLRSSGKYLTPAELKEMLDRNEEIVLVDMRNDYEFKIGRFRNAINLPISNFRDLPNTIANIINLKNKKIVAYCTGGIRCEKATAYLKENGFENVYQIKGGILKFGEEYPDTYWEGKCFVFDDRLAISLNKNKKESLTECVWCNRKCDDYLNCHNLDCDKLFVCCEGCKEIHNKSCSEKCFKAEKRRKEVAVEL